MKTCTLLACVIATQGVAVAATTMALAASSQVPKATVFSISVGAPISSDWLQTQLGQQEALVAHLEQAHLVLDGQPMGCGLTPFAEIGPDLPEQQFQIALPEGEPPRLSAALLGGLGFLWLLRPRR